MVAVQKRKLTIDIGLLVLYDPEVGKKISLTGSQDKFLCHLPFPGTDAMSIANVMEEAGIDGSYMPKILGIVEASGKHGVMEIRG
jgi:hypothetical protein